MHTLQLGLNDGETLLALQGPGAAAPVRGALLREAVPAAGETVEQVVDVALDGTAAQIEAFLERLRRELALAEAYADQPGAEARCLGARVTAGSTLRSAKILRGRVELLGAGAGLRNSGSTGVRLHLLRANYWEAPLTWLPLSNRGASRVTDGLLIYNHRDSHAGHDNYAEAAAGDALGDLPAPALLDFRGEDAPNTAALYAGQAVGAAGAVYALEDDYGAPGAGIGAALVQSASASGGTAIRLTWSGAGEWTVWSAALDPALLNGCGGRAFLPVLRLNAPNTSPELWFSWRLTVDYSGIRQAAYESAGSWLAQNSYHCPGKALFMPPWPLGPLDYPPGMSLELRVKTAGTGAHALEIDCLQLLPLDRWRIYRPVVASYAGLDLIDDPYQRTLKAGAWAIQLHQAEGPGLAVYPGQSNRYSFLMEGSGFGIGTRARVKIGYRPRQRGL